MYAHTDMYMYIIYAQLKSPVSTCTIVMWLREVLSHLSRMLACVLRGG